MRVPAASLSAQIRGGRIKRQAAWRAHAYARQAGRFDRTRTGCRALRSRYRSQRSKDAHRRRQRIALPRTQRNRLRRVFASKRCPNSRQRASRQPGAAAPLPVAALQAWAHIAAPGKPRDLSAFARCPGAGERAKIGPARRPDRSAKISRAVGGEDLPPVDVDAGRRGSNATRMENGAQKRKRLLAGLNVTQAFGPSLPVKFGPLPLPGYASLSTAVV